MATMNVAIPSFLCSFTLRRRMRFACIASSTYQARPNSPWMMNFGSPLLGCPISVNRLSENATMLRNSSRMLMMEKYAPHVLPIALSPSDTRKWGFRSPVRHYPLLRRREYAPDQWDGQHALCQPRRGRCHRSPEWQIAPSRSPDSASRPDRPGRQTPLLRR